MRSVALNGRSGRLKRACTLLAAVFAFSLLPDAGVQEAEAHLWSNWHWHRGGSKVDIYVWDQTGGCGTGGVDTNDALYDIYYNPHPIWVYCTSYHTDVSVWEQNEPYANYCGLAEIINNSGDHIQHAHARVNTYSACVNRRNNIPGLTEKLYMQGIHCQEIMHALGFDHSDTQDCMGGTTGSYFSGSIGKYFVGSTGAYKFDWDHQTLDMYSRYRYH